MIGPMKRTLKAFPFHESAAREFDMIHVEPSESCFALLIGRRKSVALDGRMYEEVDTDGPVIGLPVDAVLAPKNRNVALWTGLALMESLLFSTEADYPGFGNDALCNQIKDIALGEFPGCDVECNVREDSHRGPMFYLSIGEGRFADASHSIFIQVPLAMMRRVTAPRRMRRFLMALSNNPS